jgi:hypothetical protein
MKKILNYLLNYICQAGMTFLRKVIKIIKITHIINHITFWDYHVLVKRGSFW